MAQLADIATIRKETIDPVKEPNRLFNYLSIGNIESSTGNLVKFRPTMGKEIKSQKLVFTENDILYSRLRPNLNKVFLTDFDGISATDLLPITPHAGIDKRYLAYYLRSQATVDYAKQRLRGIQLPRISTKDLLALPIPLPPKKEQIRIADTIEALFAQSKIIRLELDDTILTIGKFRHELFAKAFNGELVKQNIDEISAQQLLTKVPQTTPLEERTQQQLFKIPNSWNWVYSQDICVKITDGEHKKPFTSTAGIPLLSAKNVRDGYLDFGNVDFVTESVANRCFKRCEPQYGDILIVTVGATIGRTALVQTPKKFCLQRTVGLIRAGRLVLPEYLYYYLKSDFSLQQITSLTRATAISHFNIDKMKRIPVPLAPIDEQERIVKKIKALLALADTTSEAVAVAKKRVILLEQTILSRAFNGILVPQNLNDEPISLHFLAYDRCPRNQTSKETDDITEGQAVKKKGYASITAILEEIGQGSVEQIFNLYGRTMTEFWNELRVQIDSGKVERVDSGKEILLRLKR